MVCPFGEGKQGPSQAWRGQNSLHYLSFIAVIFAWRIPILSRRVSVKMSRDKADFTSKFLCRFVPVLCRGAYGSRLESRAESR